MVAGSPRNSSNSLAGTPRQVRAASGQWRTRQPEPYPVTVTRPAADGQPAVTTTYTPASTRAVLTDQARQAARADRGQVLAGGTRPAVPGKRAPDREAAAPAMTYDASAVGESGGLSAWVVDK